MTEANSTILHAINQRVAAQGAAAGGHANRHPEFKDVQMSPGQALAFNEPKGYAASGEPVTELDIASFVAIGCGLKDRSAGGISRDNLVESTKAYLAKVGGQVSISYTSIGDNSRPETASRLRVTALVSGESPGTLTAIVRRQPMVPFPLEQLGLPLNLGRMIDQRMAGLVLVTGPTSNGKTTTCASMLEHFNRTQAGHIVTVEDPIEYQLAPKLARITQRELGVGGLQSYSQAARDIKRQAPNIVMIGEILDRETMDQALHLSASFLVISTVHGNNAANTISAVLNFYPLDHQSTIRSSLASYLRAVIAQALVPSSDGHRFQLAYEYLFASPTVRQELMATDTLRPFSPQRLQSVIENGKAGAAIDQSVSLNQRLAALVREGKIQAQTAMAHSYDPDGLEAQLSRIG